MESEKRTACAAVAAGKTTEVAVAEEKAMGKSSFGIVEND